LSGDNYFLGCVAMNIAGICGFILGNNKSEELQTQAGDVTDPSVAIPFAVFVNYG